MPALADSNVLLRALQRTHPMHFDAWRAIRLLKRSSDLFVVPQNIVELWVVATRPVVHNGLGLSASTAGAYLTSFRRFLPMLPDTPEVHQRWEQLVTQYGVPGKKAYDARLVACMLVHPLDTVLTFNVNDFRNYREIAILYPGSVR